jgi:hypothetical protein
LFCRRKREVLNLSGNKVYICLHYETQTRGEKGKGPPGPIMDAVIH